MSAAEDALRALADQLRGEDSVISPHVGEPQARAPLGALAAAGPRTAAAPDEYALIVEAVREGYLLHYGEPRVVRGADPDLALLGGDYLYAIGLERLAGLGDLEAVGQLSDLISLAAQVHDRSPDEAEDEARALWLATVTAIAVGPSDAHEAAKAALRAGEPGAREQLWAAALAGAAEAAIGEPLRGAALAIDFGADVPS
jgi:hypothetical protein